MEVIDCKKNIRCELGACKERATREIKFDRVGIRGRIHLCEKCLGELYAALGASLVPKSFETAKKRVKTEEKLHAYDEEPAYISIGTTKARVKKNEEKFHGGDEELVDNAATKRVKREEKLHAYDEELVDNATKKGSDK